MDLIITEGRQPRFLEIFEVVQIVQGRPLAEVQRLVLSILITSQNWKHILYMEDSETNQFSFEIAPPSLISSADYTDIPFHYHAKLLNILRNCGCGVTAVYLNEAKC